MQTNEQTFFLKQLTMNKKDVHLSKNAQIMFQLINESKMSTFEKEEIKKYFNNLFFFKTTDYDIGAFSNSFSLHIFQSSTGMQLRRSENLKKENYVYSK